MAPELYNDKVYDEKCDVYSFAIIMFELLADTVEPYNGQLNVEQIVSSNPTFRPILPQGMYLSAEKLKFVDLMTRSWAHSASKSPSFTEIIAELNEIKQLAMGDAVTL